MKNIQLDITKATQFLQADAIAAYEPKVKAAQEALENGTCPGNDFLGWLHLPSSITPDFIGELNATAQVLRENCEVVVVAGIGGSYLGARTMLCGHEVENDATLDLLAKTALSHVEAGADMVAPSDMMDGRVRAIRECLDKAGHKETPIMSYAVKYASAFYGPFRDAAGSAPSFGDRKSYQMDYHNRREGMKEALTDIEEGADIIMIKPAMSYLDMVSEVSKATNVPIAAYSVSGEYAMVKAAAKMGWIDEEKIVCEMAASAYRAGVNIYLTYYAKELARFIDEGRIG